MEKVLITAGVHGDEIGSVMIARELRGWIEGIGMENVDVIPEVNPEAIEEGMRENPKDGKDLNRCFPGDLNGTVSEVIAAELFGKAKRYDRVIDLHTYGKAGRCVPYMLTDLRKDHNREFCRRMGIPYAVQTAGTSQQMFLELSKIGIPSMIIETGGRRWLRDELDLVKDALKDYLSGRAPEKVRFFDSYQQFSVEKAGYYVPMILPGMEVKEGDILGLLEGSEVKSPVNGMVIGIKMEGTYDPEEQNLAAIVEF